jgi:hypothetical protein
MPAPDSDSADLTAEVRARLNAELKNHRDRTIEQSLGGPDIFTERGIPLEIALRRPYVRWTTENREAVAEEYKTLGGAGRGFLSRVTAQSDGYLMMREPPLGEAPIYAELRPDHAVRTGKKITHDHAKDFSGDSSEFLRRHLDKEHGGKDVSGKHTHDRHAKYLFPPSPKVEREWWHDHDDYYAGEPRRRAKHEAQAHGGEVTSGCHLHTHRVKDRGTNYAKRIEIHRDAVDLLPGAERVFYVIEGCLKADSIFAQGEAVVSVPSVTLWDPPELDWFARKYFTGKRAFIVADADWAQNPKVVGQAMLCRSFLLSLHIDAHVAAPSRDTDGNGDLRWKGVDDFWGAGHGVDELVVIRRDLPSAFPRYVQHLGRPSKTGSRLGRIDGLRRDIQALQNLILIAADGKDPRFPKGTLDKNLSQLARLMGHKHHKSAERAIERLEGYGALTISGPTETRVGGWKGDYYDSQEEWVERPTITLTPELHAVEKKELTVGALAEGIEQFPVCEPEEIDEWLREGRDLEAAAA